MKYAPGTEPTHERSENNPHEYPFEYFDVQVQFAAKWAEVTGEPFHEVLLGRTALKRRLGLTDQENQAENDIVDIFEGAGSAEEVSTALYDHYLSLPSSRYDYEGDPSEKHEGRKYFGFDWYPDNAMNGGRNTIKVHFLGNKRGEKSRLSSDLLYERQVELHDMIAVVCELHPNAQDVVGGSWLYNIPNYRDSFPPEFTENMKPLVPAELVHEIPDGIPNMALTGDSVWGQFINSNGWVNQERYDHFLAGISQAGSLLDLYNAFPLKTLQPVASKEVFLNWHLES